MADEQKTADDEDASDQSAKKPFYRRPVPLLAIAGLLLIAIVVGVVWWLHARQYVSTDDAFIAAHTVRISPRVSGRVQQVAVDDNQWVEKGDLLATLDPEPFRVRLEEAEASRAEAEAELAQAQAQLEVAEANAEQARAQVAVAEANAKNAQDRADRLQRLTGMTSSENLAVSQQSLEDAQAEARSTSAQLQAAQKQAAAVEAQEGAARSRIQSAQSQIQSAAAQVEQRQLELSYTKVEAPVAGRVTNRSVEAGGYVETGQALLALVPKQVWVTANFKETDVGRIRPGQHATIEIDAYPDRELDGTVDSLQAGTGASFSLLPPQNATGNYVKVVQRVPVKITFDRLPDDILLAPGMSVVPTVRVE